MPDKKKLFLLDAFALIYRAYYGLGENFLYNSKGMNVTAITLFTDTVNKIIATEKPTHIAIAFDTAAPVERIESFADYKANREAMPEDLKASIPYIREIIKAMNIPILEKDGFEADDVIGTVAKRCAKEGFEVYMVTPDKDYAQLVEENIYMYKPPFRGKPPEILDVAAVLDKWEIERIDQVIDILGLMGDKVDNIPGIPGVGAKTAVKLLKEFDSIENLLENTDKLKGKLREKVEDNKEAAIMSKMLATIILDVDFKYDPEEFVIEKINKDALRPIFQELEFRNLGKRMLDEDFSVAKAKPSNGQFSLFDQAPAAVEDVQEAEAAIFNPEEVDYKAVDSQKEITALVAKLLKTKEICFDTETTGLDPLLAELVGISISEKEKSGYYIPFPSDQAEATELAKTLKPLLENEAILKIGQNLKYDILVLKKYDIQVKGPFFDTMIAHFLIEPSLRHSMDFMAETYLGYSPISIETLIGKKGVKQGSMRDVPLDKIKDYAVEDSDITLRLKNLFAPQLKEANLESLFNDVEIPLMHILAEMENTGVAVDVDYLNAYSEELGKEILSSRDKIFEMAGMEFNMDSPKQLGEVLFNHMEIPYKGKKTKTGQFSTNEDTLSKLADEHAIVEFILNYRELTKLKSTYVDALPNIVNPNTGRIHSNFSQTVAATGRLSSNNPNLQNIPIRTENGRKVRKAFVPRAKENILLAADYSQIELRIIASLSEDQAMMDAFNAGHDIHSATAAKVYGVDLEGVTREMRGKAKMVNFGIIYGISAFGLSQRLKIPRGEAKELIDNYFATYPNIKVYMDQCIETARKDGFVSTILGRRRYLNDINSSNATVRGFAERNAINSPIQGSAADMIKVAMVNIHNRFQKEKIKSKLILQVHDELVFDVEKSELETIKTIVNTEMSQAIEMKVPILVEMGTGLNWLEAH